MPGVRVQPWQDGDDVPDDLLAAMRARRPGGELIGIDRILLKSFPLAEGWNALLRRVRADFSLELESCGYRRSENAFRRDQDR